MGWQPHSGGRRRGRLSFWQRAQVSLIASVGVALLWLLNLTLRYRVSGSRHLSRARAAGGGVIYAFWHNQLFSAIYFFRFQRIGVMVSSHFDGEYSARMAQHFGYLPARGSSSQGSFSALRELSRHLEAGDDVAFTIDGPRGPRYRVKSGPLWLSAQSGCPILPFYIQPKRFWRLRSWDRFRIPKPFSPVVVHFGEPLSVEGPEEEWMDRFQQRMDELRSEAQR